MEEVVGNTEVKMVIVAEVEVTGRKTIAEIVRFCLYSKFLIQVVYIFKPRLKMPHKIYKSCNMLMQVSRLFRKEF